MIVIPMAGLSKRFTEAGYKKPKFMLDLDGMSLFKHSLLSFEKYFKTETFLFISLDIDGYMDFLQQEISELEISKFEIILLKHQTKGQADTVYQGLLKHKNKKDDLLIFNIDTFRPNFSKPIFNKEINGYLEVFIGEGLNWSYIKLDEIDNLKVVETAEKNPISNLCCTGLYYFKDYKDFMDSFTYFNINSIFVKGELYVAPLYNYLIEKGSYISYKLIHSDEVVFCGTPVEYENLLKK